VRTAVARAAAHAWDGRHLLEPRAIPVRVAAVVDEGIGVVGAAGFPDGVVGAPDNPFVRNLGQQWQTAPPPPPPPPVRAAEIAQKTVERIVVASTVQEAKLVRKVVPRYPTLALQTRVEGTVLFRAVIGKDGTIQALQVVSGHPLLVQDAAAALRQWLYRPTLLNGEPVEVATTIEVRFTLNR
jgi:protein TonB